MQDETRQWLWILAFARMTALNLQRYGLKRLVYCERFEDIRDAIQREKTIKHWPARLEGPPLHGLNREWDDLYETLNQ